MTSIMYIIGAFFLVHGIYQIFKYLVMVSEIKHRALEPLSNNIYHNFCILAPVLHEENNIESFLTDLSNQDYPQEFYSVYIITTQKEYQSTKRPNTIDILEELKTLPKFKKLKLFHLHFPLLGGYKSDQLSFAFENICNANLGSAKQTYFLSLDADSTVSANTLTTYNQSITDDVEVYQQPLIWFKNLAALKSPIMKSFGFMQTFFSISYEIPMFTGKFFPWRLKYLVGHGLCVKGSYLLKLHGFPKIIEDVRIGRLSSFIKTKVKVIPNFGNVEVAKNYSTYIKQSGVWFFGCGLFISDFLESLKIRGAKVPTVRDVILLLYGFFKALRWLNKGLLHLLGIILSVILKDNALLLIFIISLLINSSIPVMLVAKDFRNNYLDVEPKKQIQIIIQGLTAAPFLYLINFIGLYNGVFKLIKFYLWGQATLPKTER